MKTLLLFLLAIIIYNVCKRIYLKAGKMKLKKNIEDKDKMGILEITVEKDTSLNFKFDAVNALNIQADQDIRLSSLITDMGNDFLIITYRGRELYLNGDTQLRILTRETPSDMFLYLEAVIIEE